MCEIVLLASADRGSDWPQKTKEKKMTAVYNGYREA